MKYIHNGRAAILHDNPDFSEALKNLLEPMFRKYFLLFTIDIFQSVDELEKEAQMYDLCFMDVILQEKDGIVLAQEWKSTGKIKDVIFVTDDEEQVFRSFSCRPIAYVRKAYLEKELDEAVRLYQKQVQASIVVIPEGHKLHVLEPEQIMYLYSNKHYIEFHMADETILVVRGKLDDMEWILSGRDFVRIHISYLIHIDYIRDIRKNIVTLKNLREFKISNKYREEAEQVLEKYIQGTKFDKR